MKSKSNDTCQDVYQGTAYNVKIFIKLKNYEAVAEWFYDEVSPAIAYIDTLKYQNNTWSGKESKIIRNKGRLYFETMMPYSLKVKIEKNVPTQWTQEYNKNKNELLLNTEYLSLLKDSTYKFKTTERVRVWQEMYIKYELYEKQSQLAPNEFSNEFIKFKRELLLKLNNF